MKKAPRFNIVNQVILGQEFEDGPVELHPDICYARAVRENTTWYNRMQDAHLVFAVFRTTGAVRLANWWMNEYLFPRLPKDVSDHIYVERLFRKGYNKLIGEAKIIPPITYSDSNIGNFSGTPWIKLYFDVDKLTLADCFTLWGLFRYPQENVSFVEKVYEIHKAFPELSLDHAVLMTSMVDLESNDNHLTLPSTTWYLGWEGQWKEWSLTSRWPKPQGLASKPYSVVCKKPDVSTYFRVGVGYGHGLMDGTYHPGSHLIRRLDNGVEVKGFIPTMMKGQQAILQEYGINALITPINKDKPSKVKGWGPPIDPEVLKQELLIGA
jgi:hypothetical protein